MGVSLVTGDRQVPPAAATTAARRFLTGYLPFLYARVTVDQLRAITPQLRRVGGAARPA